jgi:hypothetical protein
MGVAGTQMGGTGISCKIGSWSYIKCCHLPGLHTFWDNIGLVGSEVPTEMFICLFIIYLLRSYLKEK